MSAWFTNAFIALVLWGLWAFFPKLAVRHINPASSVFYEAVGVLVTGVAVALRLGDGLPEWEPKGALFAFLTGLFGTVGLYFFFSAIRVGPISVISAITALYPVVTVILAVVFLGERLSLQQAIGVVLALAAAFLLSWGGNGGG